MRLNVTQLNNQIKSIIEHHFEIVEVEGEISQVTYHHTGHIYFSIKDENSIINCVMWRSNVKSLKFRLETGIKVILYGGLNVYTPRGEYKLIVTKVVLSGVGDLQFGYEQLKKTLHQKGYFNKNKPLPKYPKNIAIITAIPSAALSDMLKIASKRWSLVKIFIYNSLMQGENAKYEIAQKIKQADKNNHEVIVIARGGGSLEDLWSFNTIEVADAIFNAKTPIISAIGHEVDVLISDYVADKRASTPSNAMEILLPDINEQLFMIEEMRKNLEIKIGNVIRKKSYDLENIKNLYKQNSISNQIKHKFEELKNLEKQMKFLMEHIFKYKSQKLINLKNNFEVLNPKNKERYGFVEITKNNKKIGLDSLNKGDIVVLSDTKNRLKAEIK